MDASFNYFLGEFTAGAAGTRNTSTNGFYRDGWF
jgi:hypothetical protein